jgi:predicted  nucleic acid-binding Zn-ribbon protein
MNKITITAIALAITVHARADELPVSTDTVRATLSKWVETQQLISKEKKDWQLGREILQERVELTGKEIAQLREKIQQAGASVTDADKKRAELISQNDALKQASASLTDAIAGLEGKIHTLLKTLPEPLRDRIKPLTQRIPTNPAETKQSLSERYQNVIGTLNEINKFNRDITVVSEVRSLPGGATMEVQALYIGLGQAYYVSPKGDLAGTGHPTADGWKWEAANDLAPRIAHAIAILKNEKVAAYISLPVSIQ